MKRYCIYFTMGLAHLIIGCCYSNAQSPVSPSPNNKLGNNRLNKKEVKGWYLGLNGGASINVVRLDYSDQPYWDYDYYAGGQYPGLEVAYRLNHQVLFVSGIHYVEKGQRTNVGLNKDFCQFNLVRNYLALPLSAQVLIFNSRFSPYVEGGIYFSYWLSGRWKIRHFAFVTNIYDDDYGSTPYFSPEINNFNMPYEFRKGSNDKTGIKDNRFDLGMLLGIGVRYNFSNNMGIYAGFRYQEGLLQLERGNLPKDHTKKYNENYSFIGCFTFPVQIFSKK
ncbi:MAG: outer membrane beta-barrel protein [Flavobacteriales bacterium]|nr:outer membrane beta-barrel protein [Flavobacteriales bacterium]